MTTTPTREVDEPGRGGGDTPSPSPANTSTAQRRPWWRSWRMGVAALIIVPTFIGQIVGTDDAWPFAPFRMFASPTRRTTAIVYPEFSGVFAHDKEVRMYSTDFNLRRAEVEAALDKHHRLPPRSLADIATSYNSAHPHHPLIELDLLNVGQAIVGGRPGHLIDSVVERWKRP